MRQKEDGSGRLSSSASASFEELKFPIDALVNGMHDPAVKQKLIANTEDSGAGGIFGWPSFCVDEELCFRKDEHDEVEREIVAQGGNAS